MSQYIYTQRDWPHFTWNDALLLDTYGRIRHRQGKLSGAIFALGFSQCSDIVLDNLSVEVQKSSEIEGEMLNPAQVRSSIARRLGMDIQGLVSVPRYVDGIVELTLDATQNYASPLTQERLFKWHTLLFPEGYSSVNRITVGAWRRDENGPMQVVSGPIGRERVHYQAPAAEIVPAEMEKFLAWVNDDNGVDPILKAGIAHLWFVMVHPFDDGNGRIGRAITDLFLARAEGASQRFYSLSSQIMKERKSYYEMLEKVQSGTLDITEWLEWFLGCLDVALTNAEASVQSVLNKARFWKVYEKEAISERQRLVLNKLLDGFEGVLRTSKWARLAKCSQDSALRDIKNLLERGILVRQDTGGRSTHYTLTEF